ncbi:hypothetical protein A3C23_04360 [Candidatus Roizmanbacteria bacterium RIFCSPHIGHO2_02_FULL_37_13b]|uniref:Uncharacterized protein n=1 Tax=Candidatus Roizmanbacteria bacterium RIFCSPLOWO2_02_FULL_36_11 TaxID=1802071 RepID=A0A1F7JH79_9BACT|nr:MAG: hypothetical protein A3C23_04360 [Candidatus Roizmanbacteria bacterium RIFCSPHIGHO2_02_FULL_37_13b]OGK54942.1 MAG: hypothetical protein A3H78_00505 [Candidatus Roizmanbacteria bacterium RIFCSPLOWO2_02_FULL_36_11]
MTDKNYSSIVNLLPNDPVKTGSSLTKEGEPGFKTQEQIDVSNAEISSYHEVVEHQPEKELKPFIKTRSETIDLPPDLKQIGVTSVASSKFPNYKQVKLPISDEKVYRGLHSPITSSLRWLAELCFFILKQAHLKIKNIHGKVVRVIALD